VRQGPWHGPRSSKESAKFLKVWIVGQIYALVAMVSAVLGVTIIIATW